MEQEQEHNFVALEDQMSWVPIEDIFPWEKNPRHNDEAVETLAASIKLFGFVAPIIVQLSSNRIMAGHTRWKACRLLGRKKARVVFADFDDDKAAAYAIADNKTAELSSWDNNILPGLLADLKEKDVDLSSIGFSKDELTNLFLEKEDGVNDPWEEWVGMPEYENEDKKSFAHVIIHFDDVAAISEFAKLLDQKVNENTKSIWYPKKDWDKTEDYRY